MTISQIKLFVKRFLIFFIFPDGKPILMRADSAAFIWDSSQKQRKNQKSNRKKRRYFGIAVVSTQKICYNFVLI